MRWLAKLFGKRQETPPQLQDAEFEQLPWLESQESPVGVRVLDCRPFIKTVISASENAEAIRFFGSPAAHSGEQFRGKHPDDALRVACDLAFPLEAPLPEGPVFLAGAMEDKWNIYHFTGVLYFARSWTGHLQYVATLAPSVSELRVVEVEAWNGNVLGPDSMATRQVDFLIRSHLFGLTAPHPTPALGSKQAIALWSFSQYGRRGLFAKVEEAAGDSVLL